MTSNIFLLMHDSNLILPKKQHRNNYHGKEIILNFEHIRVHYLFS